MSAVLRPRSVRDSILLTVAADGPTDIDRILLEARTNKDVVLVLLRGFVNMGLVEEVPCDFGDGVLYRLAPEE